MILTLVHLCMYQISNHEFHVSIKKLFKSKNSQGFNIFNSSLLKIWTVATTSSQSKNWPRKSIRKVRSSKSKQVSKKNRWIFSKITNFIDPMQVSIPALSNPVANRHTWRLAVLMWRQQLFLQSHIKGYFGKMGWRRQV